MKAVLDIEFIVAIAIFIGTISFILIAVISRLPLFEEQSALQNVKSSSYRVSDMLIYGTGSPGWEDSPDGAAMFGLSSGTNGIVETQKISALNAYCNPPDADKLVKLYDMFSPGAFVSIRITDRIGVLASCGSPDSGGTRFTAKRSATTESGSVVLIELTVSK